MKADRKWFILGAGSIGCLWAASLQQAGNQCRMIIRPKSIEQYRELPLIVESSGKNFTYHADCIASDQIPETIHRLVISLKAPDAMAAVRSILHLLAPDAIIVILLNGMGIQDEIASLVPGRQVWVGSTSDGVWKSSLLHIHHAGRGITWLGTCDGTDLPSPLPRMTHINVRLCDNIRIRLWHKLAINSVINGLTVKYQCKNGELLAREEYRAEALALAQECEQLMDHLSVPRSASVFDMSASVMKNTAENFSSTLQDIKNHRLTELPWINGFLVKQGQSAGYEMAHHMQLLLELKHMGIE